jgi:hypothetical protein
MKNMIALLCLDGIRMSTVPPLLGCLWWFSSRCWHVVAAKDTEID